MRFGSVCSGIEAASVAWHPLGWRAAWFAELEPFPGAVLGNPVVSVAWLAEVVPHDLRAAQLCAIGVLVALAGLGRMRDAFRDAGRQIDAILATLPPPADAEQLDTRKAW